MLDQLKHVPTHVRLAIALDILENTAPVMASPKAQIFAQESITRLRDAASEEKATVEYLTNELADLEG